MRVVSRILGAAGILLVVGAITAAVLTAGTAASHQLVPRGSHVAKLTLISWGQGTDMTVVPIVHVRVAGRVLPVELDTGSTGLRIFASALPRGLTPFGSRFTQSWGDGSQTTQTLAQAWVSIAGLSTTTPVNIGVIQSAECLVARCQLLTDYQHHGVAGILGVSLRLDSLLQNPLLELPAPYSGTWRIGLGGGSGLLALGVRTPGPAAAELRLQPSTRYVGLNIAVHEWMDDPEICWQLGGVLHYGCVPTYFDTGTQDIAAFGSPIPSPVSRAIGAARPGELFSAWETPDAAAPFWELVTGKVPGTNLIVTGAEHVRSIVAGIPIFRAFDVTYDAASGAIYLASARGTPRPRPAGWRQAATAICEHFYHAAEEATSRTPSPLSDPHLSARARRLVYGLTSWASISLAADVELARLRPPARPAALLSQALRSDRAGAWTMLRFAGRIKRGLANTHFAATVRDYNSAYNRAERGWNQGMRALRLDECAP